MLSGNPDWQKAASMKLIDAAVKIGAKTLVLPECGHAYMALRWMGANMYGKPLPFKVMHISEYMADALNTGKIKVKKLDKSVTYHDPFQVSRRGGATQAARDVIKHLGVDFREMKQINKGTGDRRTIMRRKNPHYRPAAVPEEGAPLMGVGVVVMVVGEEAPLVGEAAPLVGEAAPQYDAMAREATARGDKLLAELYVNVARKEAWQYELESLSNNVLAPQSVALA